MAGYYDPLQYPVLLPYWSYGWDINSHSDSGRRFTCRDYYAYMLQVNTTYLFSFWKHVIFSVLHKEKDRYHSTLLENNNNKFLLTNYIQKSLLTNLTMELSVSNSHSYVKSSNIVLSRPSLQQYVVDNFAKIETHKVRCIQSSQCTIKRTIKSEFIYVCKFFAL